jgi:hypothetical protein
LLEGNENKQKSSTELNKWIVNEYKTDTSLAAYKKLHYIPENESLEMKDFQQFFNERKKLMAEKYASILINQ